MTRGGFASLIISIVAAAGVFGYFNVWFLLSSPNSENIIISSSDRMQAAAATMVGLFPTPADTLSSSSLSLVQAENKVLAGRNKDLEYRLAMLEARVQPPLLGPRNLADLPPDLYERFYQGYHMEMRIPTEFAKYGVSKTQVPAVAQPFLEYMGPTAGWKPVWSQELIDAMVAVGKTNGDFSCEDYPQSVPQLYKAIERVMAIISREQDKSKSKTTKPMRVLVAGAISPWVEAVVLSRPGLQLEKLVTTDYNPITIESSQIEFVHMEDLKRHRPDPLFDLVISYSSIEHDGLGRYGDPINPDGDFAAIKEISLMLKDEGGFLILAVPQTESSDDVGYIRRNGQRVYSKERLDKLTEGFERIGEFIRVPGLKKVRNQPVLVLRKLPSEK